MNPQLSSSNLRHRWQLQSPTKARHNWGFSMAFSTKFSCCTDCSWTDCSIESYVGFVKLVLTVADSDKGFTWKIAELCHLEFYKNYTIFSHLNIDFRSHLFLVNSSVFHWLLKADYQRFDTVMQSMSVVIHNQNSNSDHQYDQDDEQSLGYVIGRRISNCLCMWRTLEVNQVKTNDTFTGVIVWSAVKAFQIFLKIKINLE